MYLRLPFSQENQEHSVPDFLCACRDDKIWTCDLRSPRPLRYRTAPHPVVGTDCAINNSLRELDAPSVPPLRFRKQKFSHRFFSIHKHLVGLRLKFFEVVRYWFLKSGCKGTAFFWTLQIFLAKILLFPCLCRFIGLFLRLLQEVFIVLHRERSRNKPIIILRNAKRFHLQFHEERL